MRPLKNPIQAKLDINQSNDIFKEFIAIGKTIQKILKSPPLQQYSTIEFGPLPLEPNKPRFGASEYFDTSKKLVLALSQSLLSQHKRYLAPILWREAYLLHLPEKIRQIPESADLGLYCYYRYGIKNRTQQQRFLQLWETISPPKEYTYYRYFPTSGFIFFDKVVNGTFLQKVKDWLNPFSQLSTPLTTDVFTENLERWMFNYHRVLKPIELKVLRGLNSCLDCSQIELSERIRLRQPSISQVIRVLAEKHLLRYTLFENYPVIGLHPLTIKFSTQNVQVLASLKQFAAKIRYTLSIQEFDDFILISFVIPRERLSRFQQWYKQITASLELPQHKIRIITERTYSRNFDLYNSRIGGWPKNYESILDNIFRLIREEWTEHLPPLRSFKLASLHNSAKIVLQSQDFIYLQRATDAYLATSSAKFYESKEARSAGYKDSEHMAYRRRIEFLKKHNLISEPIGLSLIHIGLNAAISLFLETPQEITKQILRAFQLFPHVAGRIFDDGTGTATIQVPTFSAVTIQSALNEFFLLSDLTIKTAIKPSVESFGWFARVPADSINYDFSKGKWIWTKDTLPHIQTFLK